MTLPGFLHRLRQVTLDEVAHVQGFMQLLMKQRNGAAWSDDDKVAILRHLRHFARSLPYLLLFTLPGGTMLFPGLAWFLDRRKDRSRVAVQLKEGDPSGKMPPRLPGDPPE
jgi:hypothetical protein